MACRLEGPALVEFVNSSGSLVTYNVKVDGVQLPLQFGPYELAAIFVASIIEFDEHPSVKFVGAMDMKGEKLEPECD